jgi:hypothetical protein
MLEDIRRLLLDAVVLEGVRQAWLESQPGPAGGHEEGGFIVQDYDRSYAVIRWPHGTADEILVPAHDGCEAQGKPIWLTFHTHPNTGSDFMQEPSEDDEIAVRDDRDLKGRHYLGEIVIADDLTYLISPQGQVSALGPTRVLLALIA